MHDARRIETEAELRKLIPEPSSKVRLEIFDLASSYHERRRLY